MSPANIRLRLPLRRLGLASCLSLVGWSFLPGGALAGQGGSSWDPAAVAAELLTLRSAASDPDEAAVAVPALTRILEELDERRGPAGELPPTEAELFLRALEYRARGHAERGAREAAADDLRILILADPARRLDLVGLSPAVVDLFETQRGELLAHLTVRTEPSGATVLVGDEPIGETPIVGRPVLAGSLDIRLERPGYAAAREPRREVFAGEMVAIERALERASPVLSVMTAPPGAIVRVAGRVTGTTAGRLPEDLIPLVPPRFSEEEFSAPLALSDLTLGANEITIEAPCRRPARFTFHADEVRDYLPRFVRLGPSTGGLRIESEPEGGRVLLDGEERGVTPLAFSAMCSGEHRVEIRHPAGRCVRSFTVSRAARTAIRCEVRPVLSFVPSGPQSEPSVDEAVRRALEGREGFFLAAEDDEEVQARLRVMVPELGAGPSRIEFFAAGSLVPDTAGFDRFAPESAARAALELLTPPVRRRPWLGLTAAVRRSFGAEEAGFRLEVSSVHPAGPAVLAGIEPGDGLIEVEGRLVPEEASLAMIVDSLSPGASVDILVRREGAARTLHLTLDETPVLASLRSRQCNRRLVALEGEFARSQRDAARELEAGICWIMLGDPSRALREHLNDLRLSGSAGIGEGTVLYYRGLALLAAAEPARAAAAFEAAAAVPGATLVTHDGPLLAPLARRRAAMPR